MGIIASSSLFKFGEAIRHCQRNEVNANLKSILRAIYYCAVDERYGVYTDEIAIIGSDVIANKLAAIILAKNGIPSTIFSTEPERNDLSGLMRIKYSAYDNMLHKVYEYLLGITVDKEISAEKVLSSIISGVPNGCARILEAKNVYPVFNCKRNGDKYYWIDYCHNNQCAGNSLIFWKDRETYDISIDGGNPPLYRGKFQHIFYTSSAPELTLLENGVDYTLLAGANRSLYDYEYYGLRDRAHELYELSAKVEQFSNHHAPNS